MKRFGVPASDRFWSFVTLFLGLILVSSPVAGPVWALTARTLGDVDHITVMEVSGVYDTLVNGQVDNTAQREIAREMIRTHGDRYDFLVVFTNFDFLMPSPDAKAFFTRVRNEVQGIGLPVFDASPAFSPAGTPLDRLQGVIDMANLNSHELNPAHPDFEKTLRRLTHEFLHRWGAYIRYLDADGLLQSDLLGIDLSHWSYLLDSDGSTLYGNNWQDNQDGTFTSGLPDYGLAGEAVGRIFSPLDLYLMGFLPAEQVPDLQLLVNPGLDPARLPEIGVTLAAAQQTVTIEQIVAAEGPRVPSTDNARKSFNVGFVYAVIPGTWSLEQADGQADLAALARLRDEWVRRFAVLTDGLGRLDGRVPPDWLPEENPELPAPPVFVPSPAPTAGLGLEWLLTGQSADGAWRDSAGIVQRDTAVALAAVTLFAEGAHAVPAAQEWLRATLPEATDFAARRLLALGSAEINALTAWQNADGGWGSADGYPSNALDTALALQALIGAGSGNGEEVQAALVYLLDGQQPDGGWGGGCFDSMLLPTAEALLALEPLRYNPGVAESIERGVVWLSAHQNSDGGFGNGTSTIYDTAQAVRALKVCGGPVTDTLTALEYLRSQQSGSGSWQASVYLTALAVAALHAGQVAPDLAVFAEDILISPDVIEQTPATVEINTQVHNLSESDLSGVRVALYQGEDREVLLDSVVVDVPAQQSAPVVFRTTINEPGLHGFTVIVDDLGMLAESNEHNNLAYRMHAVALQEPQAGFAEEGSSWPEQGGPIDLAVVLPYAWHQSIQVNYAVDLENSSADAGDYLQTEGLLTIPAGVTEARLRLELVDDQQAESDETLVLRLSGPSAATGATALHSCLILDNEPPAVQILAPAATVIGVSAPQLIYTSTASRVSLKVDGQLADKSSGDTLDPLTDGPHWLSLTAENSQGITNEVRLDFQIDTSLPQLQIISPAPGSTVNAGPALVYSVSGAAAVEIVLDGSPVNLVPGDLLGPLQQGEHRLLLTAVNQLGSRTFAESIFTVDATPPSIHIDSPRRGYLRDAEPELLYQVDEPAEILIWLDGVAQDLGSGTTFGPLPQGLHRLRIEATDAVGNLGAAQVEFVISLDDELPHELAPGWPHWLEGGFGGMDIDRDGCVYMALRSEPQEFSLVKFSADGSLLWKTVNSSYFNIFGGLWVDGEPQDLAVDSQGNIFVAGWGWLSNRYYGFIAKYDSQGRFVSYRLHDTGKLFGDAKAFAVAIDEQDQVFVAGNSEYDCFGGSGVTTTMFVARYNNDLGLQAYQSLGDPWQASSFRFTERGAATIASDGRLLLAGSSLGGQMLLWSFPADLNSFQKLMEGPAGTYGSDVATDRFGTTYVSGRSSSGPGYIWILEQGQIAFEVSDPGVSSSLTSLLAADDGTVLALDSRSVLHKLDRDRHWLWSTPLGNMLSSRLAADPEGGIAVAGSYWISSQAGVARIFDPRDPGFSFARPVFYSRDTTVVLSGSVRPGIVVEPLADTCNILASNTDLQTGAWQIELAGLAPGDNLVQVVATGSGGLPGVYQVKVIVDQDPPEVRILSPVDGSSHLSKPQLHYTVSEGTVRVTVNGIELTKKSGFALDSLFPGENLVRVESVDQAGNLGFDQVRIIAEQAAVGELPFNLAGVSRFGTIGEQTLAAMGQDSLGHVFLFGETASAFPGYQSQNRDLYVAKLDQNGTLLSVWQLGSPGVDFAADLLVAADGGFTILYNYEGTDAKGASMDAMVVARYSPDGALLWQDELDSGSSDHAAALAVDPAGNLLIAGSTGGRLHNQKHSGDTDYFISKYSANGRRIWTVVSNQVGPDSIQDLAVDSEGAVFATGRVNAQSAMSLLRFTENGAVQWQQVYQYSNHYMSGEQLVVGADSVHVLIKSNYTNYYFLASYLKTGEMRWDHYEFSDNATAMGLVLGPEGHLYVCGQAGDPYARGWSFDGNQSFGDEDLFLAKHSVQDGTILWSRQFGDHDSQQGVRLLFDPVSGRGFVGGVSNGDFGGPTHGAMDLFLAGLEKPVLPAGPELVVNPYQTPSRLLTQSFSGRASAGATLQASVSAPQQSAAVIQGLSIDGAGHWMLTVAGLVANTKNTVTIQADNEWGTTRQTLEIDIDTLPPLLSVNAFVTPTVQSSLTLNGTVEAGSRLSISDSGTGFEHWLAVEGTTWSFAVSGLLPGDNDYILRAIDPADNISLLPITIVYQPLPAMEMTLVPQSVGEDEQVDVLLTIDQIHPPGSVVTIEEWFDLDANGVVDTADPLLRRLLVTDGSPADIDQKVDGTILLTLDLQQLNDRQHAPGHHLFRASAGTRDAAVALEVVPAVRSQGFRGLVVDTTGNPVAGAEVGLFDKWRRALGYAFSDQDGVYHLTAQAPGQFLLAAETGDGQFDTSALSVHELAGGEFQSVDLILTPGSFRAVGRLVDAVSRAGIPGIRLRAEGALGQAATLTDTTGSFVLFLNPGDYRLSAELGGSAGLSAKGYLGTHEPLAWFSLNASDVVLEPALTPAIRPVCGRVQDLNAEGIAGLVLQAVGQGELGQVVMAGSAADGVYCVAVDAAQDWDISVEDSIGQARGYLGPARVVAAGAEPLAEVDLRVVPTDCLVEGVLQDGDLHAVPGLEVSAREPLSGSLVRVKAADDGSYRLGLHAGVWELTVQTEAAGYQAFEPILLDLETGSTQIRNLSLSPEISPINSLQINAAVYNDRKQILTVEATSDYADARLEVVDYGPMTFSRVFKNRYIWQFSQSVPVRPALITVSGPEGEMTAVVE